MLYEVITDLGTEVAPAYAVGNIGQVSDRNAQPVGKQIGYQDDNNQRGDQQDNSLGFGGLCCPEGLA